MNLATIIEDVKKGSDLACQFLLSTTRGPMMAVCGRYMKDARDAEEKMLDGFEKCFRSLPDFTYESDTQFYVWLKRIMIRQCVTQLRKKQHLEVVPETVEDDEAMEPEVFSKLSAEDIFKIIDKMPTGYRTVLNLHVLDGLEHKDIALMLGIKESTSRSQLTKARVFLKKILIENGYNHVRTRPMECPEGENE